MSKKITASQQLGEIGEAAVRLRFLNIGFQFDGRSRLEAGIDGIAEIMIEGQPLARMIAVQIKTTESSRYTSEDENGFNYLLNPGDLSYWRGSNLPVILVLYRKSDETYFWKEIERNISDEVRRVHFDKLQDVLNSNAVNKLAALTVPKAGFGYYVPPLGDGEEALVNMLPIILPNEIFVSSTRYSTKQAMGIMLDAKEFPRFDWVIRGDTFWSFSDPRDNSCRHLVDLDQVEAIDTDEVAFTENDDDINLFSFLLRKTFNHQFNPDLRWEKTKKIFYFKAVKENTNRVFGYDASKKRTSTEVVNVALAKGDKSKVDFVRHHAFAPRFECLYNQWYLVISPTYFFTTNGHIPHSHPAALLSGKKRLDKSASLRGQIIMWHRFITEADREEQGLFAKVISAPRLRFEKPPTVELATRVPEDVWGTPMRMDESEVIQERLF